MGHHTKCEVFVDLEEVKGVELMLNQDRTVGQ